MTSITLPPTDAEVLRAVRETIEDGPGDYRLPDFLAAVDWSEAVRPPREVAHLLGSLELWDCEYREGDIGWDELAARLDALSSDTP